MYPVYVRVCMYSKYNLSMYPVCMYVIHSLFKCIALKSAGQEGDLCQLSL